ncbi:MAG TPA: hypothetical protein VKC63_04820 [Solirubrobacterales bacterium]|nr:hypothetical protein [Solirubrobacterales bacterium]
MASQKKQVATRVSSDVWEVLQIGLLVEGADTMQDLLQPVVEAYAEELEKAEEVQAIRANARKFQDRKRGITRLQSTRSEKSKPHRRGRGAAKDSA